MNRVRKINDQYQVLLTPHRRYDSGIELMLGNWTDPHFDGFYVETYNTWEDAMSRAYQLPDINWDQLVLFHKDIYSKLFDIVRYEINVNSFDVQIEPRLLLPRQAKDLMFDRVLGFGERFRLAYHMNDVIAFFITAPYSANLMELAEILSVNQALRIAYKTEDDTGIIRLVGKTDLGTSYEILLAPTLIAHWSKWAMRNPQIPTEQKVNKLKEIKAQQKDIDKKLNITR
jgi:hypothetical protein